MNLRKTLLIIVLFAALPILVGGGFARFQVKQADIEAWEHAKANTPKPPPPVTVVVQEVPKPMPEGGDTNEGPIDLSATEYLEVSTELKGLVENQDPRAALEQIATWMDTDKKILRSCHGLVHAIGHWGFKKYGSFAGAMVYSDDVCGNGYMHGVIEESFVNVADIITAMKTLCQPGQWGCFHAIGHGLMYYKENDLYAALPLCSNLQGGTAQAYCSEGVYMENFETNSQVHQAKFLRPEDPFYPCYEPTAGYKDSCYYYSGRYLVRLHKDDYMAALRHCNQVPEKQFATTCARGVGAVTVRQNLSDPKAVEFICSQASVDLVGSCIYGAMSYYSVTYQSAALTRTNFCGKFSSKYYADLCKSFVS